MKRFWLGRAVVADWHAASESHPDYFYDDGIHLNPAGERAYASLISSKAPS